MAQTKGVGEGSAFRRRCLAKIVLLQGQKITRRGLPLWLQIFPFTRIAPPAPPLPCYFFSQEVSPMCEWRHSEFNPPPAFKSETSSLSAASPQRGGSFGSCLGAVLSLAAVLGLATGVWLLESSLAAQMARSYTARSDVSLESEPGESYETLLRRAETEARAAVERSFYRDILVSDVSIFVLGENKGAIAPILSLDVSRNQWRSRPAVERWAKYYLSSKILLGFGTPQQAPARQPGTAPTPLPGTAPAPLPGTAPAPLPGTAPTGQPGTAPARQPAPATGPVAPQTGPVAPPAGSRSLRSQVRIFVPARRLNRVAAIAAGKTFSSPAAC